jgi:anti-anti-sigma regulatory factor
MLKDVECVPVLFTGSLTVSNIEAAHDELRTAVSQNSTVLIDLGGVTEADLTFIQLIEAARRRVSEAGGEMTLRDPAAGAVLEVLRRGGFLDDDGSDRAKFWLQEATQQ